ncbi:class I SAM-dependent methyltransferase [Candidatus Woesearchaeota archaeon]|nr:class I SAM-dependent methyltransferase [Candidatus Woesearchaeota archaeon]
MVEHYFTERPMSKRQELSFKTKLLGNVLTIHSASSIFSLKEVDFGTRLLIENAQIPQGAKVLDLGCGYGVVGIAIKKARPDIEVIMVDVNQRAVILSKKNCSANGVKTSVFKSNKYSNENVKDALFDTVLTNPPFSAGKKLCIEFIEESHAHLRPGGTLQLVAPHNKGGSSLKKEIERVFGNVSELARRAGYRVYCGRKA